MHAILPTSVALLVLSTFALRAQAGNETIFIGSWNSIISPENHLFVASGSAATLLVDPLVSAALVGPGNSATWTFPVPGTQSLFGFQFFSQAFPFDPAANPFGFTASNGAVATLGF